jgi:hypothetical protein
LAAQACQSAQWCPAPGRAILLRFRFARSALALWLLYLQRRTLLRVCRSWACRPLPGAPWQLRNPRGEAFYLNCLTCATINGLMVQPSTNMLHQKKAENGEVSYQ